MRPLGVGLQVSGRVEDSGVLLITGFIPECGRVNTPSQEGGKTGTVELLHAIVAIPLFGHAADLWSKKVHWLPEQLKGCLTTIKLQVVLKKTVRDPWLSDGQVCVCSCLKCIILSWLVSRQSANIGRLHANLSQLESCALNDVYFVARSGLQWAAVSATTVLFP